MWNHDFSRSKVPIIVINNWCHKIADMVWLGNLYWFVYAVYKQRIERFSVKFQNLDFFFKIGVSEKLLFYSI